MTLRILSSALFALALAVSACRPAHAAPEVVVTIKPLHGLVAGVMEGAGAPALLMDGMTSPHTYQMRPSDARLIARADLVFWVDPGIEEAMPAMLEAAREETRVVQVTQLEGLHLLPVREAGIRLGTRDLDHHHTEYHEGSIDPHIWLDPANARRVTEAVVTELSSLDPGHANLYAANGAAQIARLEALEAELRARLAPVRTQTFITFHDAFQYFEAAFGLSGIASISISAERGPGGRTLMALREAIRQENVVCVFAEPQFEPRLIETLIEGTAARAGLLDPLGDEIAPGPLAYDALMRTLVEDAVACLGDDSRE